MDLPVKTCPLIYRSSFSVGTLFLLNTSVSKAPTVQAAEEQDYEEFGKKEVSQMSAEEVKSVLMQAGLFAFIRQRPYDVIADPAVIPKAIFISAFDSKPLAPDFEFALAGEE
ncbi:Na(+)-translocating NADH-quinone reductase subunit A, partial [termite gut metagenome]